MIDTHTHLYMPDSFPDGGKAAVEHAVICGVEMMVLPAVDRESAAPLLALHSVCPDHTAPALGLHPTEVEADWREELSEILALGKDVSPVAIGETGLDLHWDQRFISRQMDAFGEQIQIAADMGLPVIVHSRDALKETIEVVGSFTHGLPTLVFHSFTGGVPEMESLIEVAPNAFFGINGVITFKNAKPLKEAVERMDPERIVTETDSPYLAPVPYRGKTNESAYIPYIVKAIAELKGLSGEETAALTKENAKRLFPLLR